MEINKDFFWKFSIVIFAVSIFIGYMIGNLYVILFIAFFIAMATKIFFLSTTFNICINDIIWIFCCYTSAISIAYSKDIGESINITFMLICCIGVKISLQNITKWQVYLIKIFLFFSSLHVVATVLYQLFPNMMIDICRVLLSPTNFATNMMLYKAGGISGITGQTGVNAFYISIFIGIIFSKLLFNSRYKAINVLLLIIGIYCLTLTGKRGMFIFSIIGCIFLLFIMKKNNKEGIIKIVSIIALGIIIYVIIFNNADNMIMSKFKILSGTGDVTNGRIEIWKLTLQNFELNYLFGTGMNSIGTIIGELTHNIYIQLLSDVGIIGFSIFMTAFTFSIVESVMYFKKISYRDTENKEEIATNMAISIYVQVVFLLYGCSGNPLYGVIFFAPYIVMVCITNTYKYEERMRDIL